MNSLFVDWTDFIQGSAVAAAAAVDVTTAAQLRE